MHTTRTTPFRLMILQFSQIRFTLERTFIIHQPFRAGNAAFAHRPSVNTSTPSSVIASVCSKCADHFRSFITTTQPDASPYSTA